MNPDKAGGSLLERRMSQNKFCLDDDNQLNNLNGIEQEEDNPLSRSRTSLTISVPNSRSRACSDNFSAAMAEMGLQGGLG
jgi:hypothetical protein